MKHFNRISIMFSMITLLALGGVTAGCTAGRANTRTPGGSSQSVAKSTENLPSYYDFGDVLLPAELKIDKKTSFVFQNPGFSAGVLSLKGRVESGSLISFFEKNMAKDNWSPVTSFKSPRSILMFKKANRWCVINITSKSMYTYAEIWVAPNFSDVSNRIAESEVQ